MHGPMNVIYLELILLFPPTTLQKQAVTFLKYFTL